MNLHTKRGFLIMWYKIWKKIFIFCWLLTTFFVNLYCASYPMFRMDSVRSGKIYEIFVPKPQPQGWSFELQGEIIGSPVVKNGIVYFGSRDGSVWALDGFSGEVVWQYSTSGWVDSTPCLYGEYLYILSRDGKLYCFKQLYGSEEDIVPVWTFDTQSKSCSSPIVVDTTTFQGSSPKVIFVSGPRIDGVPEGFLYIVDAINGTLVTKLALSMFGQSSPSVDDGKVYFTTNDGTVYCYKISTNEILWKIKMLSCLNFTTAIVKDNILYYYSGDMDGKVYAVNTNNGTIVWVSPRLSNVATDNTSIALSEDKIFVNIYPTQVWETVPNSGIFYSSQSVVCINKTNGNIIWKKDFLVTKPPKFSYGITSPPTVTNNVVCFGTYNGELYVLTISTGGIVAKYEFSSPIVCSPAVSNGWVYFATVDNKFYGIKAEKSLAIKNPDVTEIVINQTPIVVTSEGFDNEMYEVQYSSDTTKWITISSGTLSSGTTTVTIWNTGHLYDGKYYLKFVLPQNNTNFAMNKLVIDNSPFPPTNITAMYYANLKTLLCWTKSLDDGGGNNDVVSYKIYRATDTGNNFSVISTVTRSVTYYIDTVPSSDTTYYYKITAVDKHSESIDSNIAKIYFAQVFPKPSPPRNLTGVYTPVKDDGYITLSWESSIDESTSAGKVVKYEIYKSSNDVSQYKIIYTEQTVGRSSYTYVDTSIVIGVTYYYFVTSVNEYDVRSDSSNIVSVWTFSPKPLPPRNLTAIDFPDDTGGKIILSWEASLSEYLSGNDKVVEYKIYKSSQQQSFWLLYTENIVGKSSYTFYDIECPVGTTFYYYVVAVNGYNFDSDPSEIVSAYSIINTTVTDTTPPQAPTNLECFDTPNDTGKSITLKWTKSLDDGQGANNVIRYKIYRSTTGLYFEYHSFVTAGTTFYKDTVEQDYTTYYYYITALGMNMLESKMSNIAFAYSEPDGIPLAPTNLVVFDTPNDDGKSLTLVWNKSGDDDDGDNDVMFYKIYKGLTQDTIQYYTQVSRGVTIYVDMNCVVDTLYYYYITAVDSDGFESMPSNIVSGYPVFDGIVVTKSSTTVLRYEKDGRYAELKIEPGSVDVPVQIKISKPQVYDTSYPKDTKPTGLVYEFAPQQEIKFKKPVSIKISYLESDIKGLNEKFLRLYWYDDTVSQWRLLNNSTVDTENNFVEAKVLHLSLYRVLEYSPTTEDIFKPEYVYTYPSPAKGDTVYFKFIIYQPAKVKVYVYNIAGEIIWCSEEFVYKQEDVGKAFSIPWNIEKIATGMYVYRVEGVNENKTQRVIKKMVVIH